MWKSQYVADGKVKMPEYSGRRLEVPTTQRLYRPN